MFRSIASVSGGVHIRDMSASFTDAARYGMIGFQLLCDYPVCEEAAHIFVSNGLAK